MAAAGTGPSPAAGQPAAAGPLVDVDALLGAYYDDRPDPAVAAERVAFGTSGHRGSSLTRSFNELHILAVTQAICRLRRERGIDGPLFLGMDTHALSAPACDTALEVLAANDVQVRVADPGPYTPTPAVSRAILVANAGRERGLADGVIMTPSHNPPGDGGIKYNPPHGGPADQATTRAIESRANDLLENGLREVRRIPLERARRAATVHGFDFAGSYVAGLGDVVDLDVVRNAGLRLAVDPLGGAGIHYWDAIAERYGIDLTVVNRAVDPTFRFMTRDRDGAIRMDPSSPFAMQRLLALRGQFDLAFACDTDHDRHGIVTPGAGLLPANHYLTAATDYLLRRRSGWPAGARAGRTAVTTALIDRVARRLNRDVYETPVGFKWFVDGLLDGSLGLGAEESAGAAFLCRDGTVWTTDKDGIAAALLAAEMTARVGRDPGAQYTELAGELGAPAFRRVEAPASPTQKALLAGLSPDRLRVSQLAGERVLSVRSRATGNGALLGGLKVATANAWFAARPSGTEDVYRIYAESFRGEAHLDAVLQAAQATVTRVLTACPDSLPAGGE